MKKRFLVAAVTFAFALLCFGACGSADEEQKPTPVSFTVTFETNGGTPIEAVTSDRARTLEKLLDGKKTVREDKVFDGWYFVPSLTGEKVPYDMMIETSMTLYAWWRDFTDVETLANAVANMRTYAVAAHDSGMVRFNTASYSVNSWSTDLR